MPRVIKAPQVKISRPMRIVDRERTLQYVEDEIRRMKKRADTDGQEMVDQSRAEAEQIIAQAQAEAEQIITQAQGQAGSIRETAKQEGNKQGEAAARQEVRKEVAGLMADLAHMIEEAHQTLVDIILNQEREIRRLVAQIASKVVLKTVGEDHETVARIARECISRATSRQSLTILIHPQDREIIEQYCPEYRVAFDDLEKIELQEDPRVSRGSVIVETATGGVDGRIHRQLAVVRETTVPDDTEPSPGEEDSTQEEETTEST